MASWTISIKNLSVRLYLPVVRLCLCIHAYTVYIVSTSHAGVVAAVATAAAPSLSPLQGRSVDFSLKKSRRQVKVFMDT